MSSLATLTTLFQAEIQDPTGVEVDTGASSTLMGWFNRVWRDAAMVTDCLQETGSITGNGAESYALPIPSVAYRITVLLTTLAGKTITITVSGVPTTTGAIAAAGTVTLMAEAIAVTLDAIAGVGAYSDGANVYVIGTGGSTIDSLTSNGTPSMITIDSGATTFWRALSVNDRTNGIVYLPCTRREYQAFYDSLVVRAAGGGYYYNLYGHSTGRKLYLLPLLVSGVITVEFSVLPATVVYSTGSETPAGLLNQYDELTLAGTCVLYFASAGDEQQQAAYFARYVDQLKRLANEVGTNPELLPEMSSLYRVVVKSLREAKG